MMRTWVEISKDRLLHNFQSIKGLLKARTQFLAVLKSNAYGHGLREAGECLKNAADWFGVDSIDEALALQRISSKPILVLGYTLKEKLSLALKHNLRLTVYDPATIAALGKLAGLKKTRLPIHLKIETGAWRQGVPLAELRSTLKVIKNYPALRLEGISTHFANIEDTLNHSYAARQLKNFFKAELAVKKAGFQDFIKHAAASAASILFPQTHFDLVRVGLGLFGLWPSEKIKLSASRRAPKLIIKPALTWKTRVAQIKTVPAGEAVGYGLTERVRRKTWLAVLPVGYFDGFDRKLSSIGEVLVGGRRAKVIGRVCMNMIMVDVTGVATARPEDEAVIIGRQGAEEVTAEELAEKIGTINYEVVTRINPLIPRLIV